MVDVNVAGALIREIVGTEVKANMKRAGVKNFWRNWKGMTRKKIRKKLIHIPKTLGGNKGSILFSDPFTCFWVIANKPPHKNQVYLEMAKDVLVAHLTGHVVGAGGTQVKNLHDAYSGLGDAQKAYQLAKGGKPQADGITEKVNAHIANFNYATFGKDEKHALNVLMPFYFLGGLATITQTNKRNDKILTVRLRMMEKGAYDKAGSFWYWMAAAEKESNEKARAKAMREWADNVTYKVTNGKLARQ